MNKFTGNYTDIFKLSKQGSSFKLRSLVEAGGPTTSPPTTPSPTTTGAPGGITPVNDNKVRFYLPAGTTSITVGGNTSTGYYAITDGTNTSTDGGYSWMTGTYAGYAGFTSVTLSGMSNSVAKVVELYPTDGAGNYNAAASIYGFVITQTTGAVDAVDMSYCTQINTAIMHSSSYWSTFGGSNLSQSITEIRAVNVVGTSPSHGLSAYGYAQGGINLAGQNLDATALNQLYTDLGSGSNDGMIVQGNPGTSSDSPSIATAKGWTIYGS